MDDNGNVTIKTVGTALITAVVEDTPNCMVAARASAAAYYLLTVEKCAVTVKVDDVTKYVGEDDPELTWTVVSGTPVSKEDMDITLIRDKGEEIGKYAITAVVANDNYDVTFVEGGEFTIAEKPVVKPDPEDGNNGEEQTKPEAKPESKPDSKPDAKPESKPNDKNENPKTGDPASIGAFVTSAIASAAVAVTALFKRRRND